MEATKLRRKEKKKAKWAKMNAQIEAIKGDFPEVYWYIRRMQARSRRKPSS
jgi:hypothetical protein